MNHHHAARRDAGMKAAGRFVLLPERDVEILDGRMVATSEEPWLQLLGGEALFSARYIEIRYRSSLLDDPVRPMLRFWTPEGHVDEILPGPVAGAGVWTGRVPKGTQRISLSPTNRAGRFDFRVESMARIAFGRLFLRGLLHAPVDAIEAVLGRLAPGGHRKFAWSFGFTPLARYEDWKRVRARPMETEGIDAPRSDWTRTPPFLVKVSIGDASAERIEVTAASLTLQTYERWRCVFEGDADPAVAREIARWRAGDRRFDAGALGRDHAPTYGIAIEAGDRLSPEAFACIVEHGARNPANRFIYADEEFVGDDGLAAPQFKPGWSPLLQRVRPYTGRMCARLFETGDAAQKAGAALAPRADAPPSAVGHVRRLLMCAHARYPDAPVRAEPAPAKPPPSIAVIIPSREQLPLLRACLDSVHARTAHPLFEVIVVDNGSVDSLTHEYYASLSAGERSVRVLHEPGPFNFSRLCNAGAKASGADVLIFLNNDTEVRTFGWMERLATTAMEDDAGAVGAKLLYPTGGVQHVDVVLGLRGAAGLRDLNMKSDMQGWAGRNVAPHECSAVVGACLVVARKKFEAVGGFEENLAIELNDVDLCLRLAERGWRCIADPRVELLHHEGASRSATLLQRFRRNSDHERAFFEPRWRSMIRDDPFYHPALSLHRSQMSLS